MNVNVEKIEKDIFIFLEKAQEELSIIQNEDLLNQSKSHFLGKENLLQLILTDIKKYDADTKKIIGQLVNNAKSKIELLIAERKKEIRDQFKNEKTKNTFRDLTLPGKNPIPGSHHPLSIVEDKIIDIMTDMGYSIAMGPQIEDDFHNFDALNFPKDHPARDMQDTFFLEKNKLLRTHTSSVQVRTMLSNNPPIRICAPGPVFRADNFDMTHSPNFRQAEVLHIDKGINISHLKGTLKEFVGRLFDKELNIKMRPSFFPFTEPSVEVDVECPFCNMGCRVCKNSKWIEILGAGMVDPNVLENCGIDPSEWQGFAFGVGIDRVAMLLYEIDDMRLLYENDIRFLSQF
jgi:phenylalanyl-tRNA synthetase alpha chain